jgi:hypothetical protein
MHRYTGRPICANPCDGYDDICEDYSDEECEGVPFISIMIYVGTVTIVTSGIVTLFRKSYSIQQEDRINGSGKHNTINMNSTIDVENSKCLETYAGLRTNVDFTKALSNLLYCYQSYGYEQKAKQISHHYYKMERMYCKSQEECVDDYYLNYLGTNESTKYFYDIIDNSWVFQVYTRFTTICPMPVKIMSTNIKMLRLNQCLKFLVRVMFHYVDLVKDVILLIQIWQYMLGSNLKTFFAYEFPAVTFVIILTSLAASEISLILILISSNVYAIYSIREKVLSVLLIIVMPAVTQYQEMILEMKKLNILVKTKQIIGNENLNESKLYVNMHLSTIREKIQIITALRVDFRANTNVLEHFVQLVLLLLILLLRETNTANVVQMNKIFFDVNYVFIILSSTWSFVSLLRGQLAYIEALKNNCIPMLGKVILLSFYTIGLAGRLFAIVLFCTPLLGLCDTNYHGYYGATSTDPGTIDGLNTYTVYDYQESGTPIFFENFWHKFLLNDTVFFYVPVYFYYNYFIVIVIHIVLGCIFQSKMNRSSKERETKKIFQNIYTLLCPPLFLDWELVYQNSKGLITVKKCWIKSQTFLIYHIIIHLVEHVLLCIPLMMLKRAIADRNEKLSDLFPPLKDELYSTYIVNVLLAVGIVVAFVLPPLQYGLAHLYFVKGHPWSRILNAKLNSGPPAIN